MLHRHELRRLEQRVAAEVLQQRRAEQRVGAPEHRGERDEEDGEAVDHWDKSVMNAGRSRCVASDTPRTCPAC